MLLHGTAGAARDLHIQGRVRVTVTSDTKTSKISSIHDTHRLGTGLTVRGAHGSLLEKVLCNSCTFKAYEAAPVD